MKKIAIFISILAVSISSCTLPSNKGGKSTADIQRNERKIETESTSAEEIEKDYKSKIRWPNRVSYRDTRCDHCFIGLQKKNTYKHQTTPGAHK